MLFRKPELLEEDPGDELIGLDEEADRISGSLRKLVTRGQNSIVAYLGVFGSGRSTLLKRLQTHKNGYDWMPPFEPWRYSDRNKIWDGFVIQTTAHLTGDDPIKVADYIEGERWSVNELVFKNWRWLILGGIFFLFVAASVFVGSALKNDESSWWLLSVDAFIKYLFPAFLALVAVLGVGSVVPLKKRPLRRIFELENKLAEVLADLKKPLIVVIEDVDRTGEEGPIFLETLRSFLRRNPPPKPNGKPVIVIAPQSQVSFDALDNDSIGGYQRSLKIYDHEWYARLLDTRRHELTGFFKSLGTEGDSELLRKGCESLIRSYPTYMTMRLLKRVLRRVQEFVEADTSANPTVVLALISLHYVVVDRVSGGGKAIARDVFILHHSESRPLQGFYEVLKMVTGNSDPVHNFDVTFSETEPDISIELHRNHAGNITYATFNLNSKYEILAGL